MYGAILGDMVGCPFEFDRGSKSKEFEMFTEQSRFTDDSVMTVAVAEALLDAGYDSNIEMVKELVIQSMRKWGRKYSNAGYGGSFYWWLQAENPTAYNSYGNGSAMRVSAAGWLYDTLERTRKMARATAEVTHNHPEGIKGAEATASAIYMARTGCTKEEIKKYIIKEFHYDLSRTCDEIRPTYRHVESCQETVPEAITAFLEGDSFEDVIRTAVSLGGDCDTLTAIAGSIAEAFYGIPDEMIREVRARLGKEMLEVVDRFDACLGRGEKKTYEDGENRSIEESIAVFVEEANRDNFIAILNSVHICAKRLNQFIVPVEPIEELLELIDPENIKVGDVIKPQKDVHMKMRKIEVEGKEWLVAFTSSQEVEKGSPTSTLTYDIDTFIEEVARMKHIEGFIINPWDKPFMFSKEIAQMYIEAMKGQ